MSEQPAPSQEKQSVTKTILLVEDDANIGEVFLQAILQETSYFAVLAASGQEALALVKNIKPNLFILDYQLPHMNGLELYDTLHVITDFEHIPAMMMSARLPHQELAKRTIIGLSKPIDLDEFLQTIEKLLA